MINIIIFSVAVIIAVLIIVILYSRSRANILDFNNGGTDIILVLMLATSIWGAIFIGIFSWVGVL